LLGRGVDDHNYRAKTVDGKDGMNRGRPSIIKRRIKDPHQGSGPFFGAGKRRGAGAKEGK